MAVRPARAEYLVCRQAVPSLRSMVRLPRSSAIPRGVSPIPAPSLRDCIGLRPRGNYRPAEDASRSATSP